MKTHGLNFYLNRLSKMFFIRPPEIIYDRIICSFTISLSYPRMHPLSLFFFFYFILCVLFSVTNTQQLLTIPIVYCYLCPSFLKNKLFINFVSCLEKRLFLKYLKNYFKIFRKYFLIVIVLYIFKISLCVTSP